MNETRKLTPAEVAEILGKGGVLVVDVREPSEVQQSGRLKGAINVPRGMIEVQADPASGSHDPAFRRDRTVVLYCAVGGRAGMAAQTLRQLGYTSVYNGGGYAELAAAGLETEPA